MRSRRSLRGTYLPFNLRCTADTCCYSRFPLREKSYALTYVNQVTSHTGACTTVPSPASLTEKIYSATRPTGNKNIWSDRETTGTFWGKC
ncbi:unnamed protein product [Ectocarpus sp. 12 AP-2014]